MTALYKQSDPTTDLILDEIARHESAGNYNAVIGNSHSVDPLDQYTLGDLDHVMDNLLDQGNPSTAIGRYQIIRSTLHTLSERAQVPLSEHFTPEFQDRLGFALLCQRGYRDWWRGAISDSDFLHRLSMEWASLPDPYNGGRSHYDGIGPNHAGTTTGTFYAVLHAARARISHVP